MTAAGQSMTLGRRAVERMKAEAARIGRRLTESEWVQCIDAAHEEVRAEQRRQAAQLGPAGRPRDLLWERLIAECGIVESELTKSGRGAANEALKMLRPLGAAPEDITARARVFRMRWPGVALTPTGLAKQWAALGAKRDVHRAALADEPAGWREYIAKTYPLDGRTAYEQGSWERVPAYLREEIHERLGNAKAIDTP